MEQDLFEGRVAFVTGGARGIGMATASALLQAGAKVVIADRDPECLEAARADLKRFGSRAETLVLDVTDPEAVANAARNANHRHGSIDILVANAGITAADTPAVAITDEAWRQILDVDLDGVFWSCREFGRAMVERGRGSIVTLGSISGLISNRPQRQAHYNTAKAGVHHLTKCLAAEWASSGVRVNSVAPTYVDTPMSRAGLNNPDIVSVWMGMTPMGRAAGVDEIASVIVFLASDASSAITGAVVPVDCGYTIW